MRNAEACLRSPAGGGGGGQITKPQPPSLRRCALPLSSPAEGEVRDDPLACSLGLARLICSGA